MTDPNGGLGEEPLTRRLPLRNSADTTQATARPAGEPWRGGELDEDRGALDARCRLGARSLEQGDRTAVVAGRVVSVGGQE